MQLRQKPGNATVSPAPGGHGNLSRVEITADGKRLLTGTWHGYGVKIWNALTGELEEEHFNELESIVPTAHPQDPGMFLTGWAGLYECRVEDMASCRLIKNRNFQATGVPRYSPDAEMVAIRSNSFEFLFFLDPRSFESIALVQTVEDSRLTDFAFSSNGRHIAIACFDNLQIMDLTRTREELGKLGLDW